MTTISPSIARERKEMPRWIIEGAAGTCGGIVSTMVAHPLDLLKTRLQVTPRLQSRFGDSYRVIRDIFRNEGSYAGLYRGFVPNAVGNSFSWGIYFVWYAAVKDLMRQHLRDGDLKSIDYFTASATSGVLTSLCTNPIWVVKTRMLSTAKDTPGAYRTVREGVAHIWRTEGLSGFYRGLVPSLLGTSHGAVQFYVYEKLKRDRKIAKKRREGPTTVSKSDGKDEKKGSLKDKELDEDHLSSVEYLVLSASAKLVAGSATYPYQVVRARLQTHDAKVKYNGARDLVRQIWTREGVRGFYRGLGPNLIRVVPASCVNFVVYENIKFYFPLLFEGDKAADKAEV